MQVFKTELKEYPNLCVVLSVIIAGYSISRPGAFEGVKYFLIPNFDNFSWMTIVSAISIPYSLRWVS